MKNSFLPKMQCHACPAIIPAGAFFCEICGRSRAPSKHLQFKLWELLFGSVLIIAIWLSLSYISTIMWVALFSHTLTPPIPTAIFVPTNTPLIIPTNTFLSPTQTIIVYPTNPPVPTLKYVCSDTRHLEFKVGSYGITTKNNISIHKKPSDSSPFVRTLRNGEHIIIIGGPICVNGSTWWQVNTESSNTGWTPEIIPGIGKPFKRAN